jgi:hypothetical protein
MEGRTFSWQPEIENPRLFEAEDCQPTKHQVKSDRAARERRRADARKQLIATGHPLDLLAVRMQPKGYGIEAIHKATGVERYLIRKLVLGE